MALYVVGQFNNRDPSPLDRRFHDRGRLIPDGLIDASSWVERTLDRGDQVMETGDAALLEQWMANCWDLVAFEAREVLTPAEAAAKVAPRL